MRSRARINLQSQESELPSNGTQTPGEIEMDLNGDGIVDESESQMVEQFENIRNSFIVELKPTAVGSINETLQALTPDLAAAGGTVSAVYDQFGMFGLKFEGPQAEADRFIGTLKEHPAVEAVYNDSIITTQQTTKQVIPNNIDRVDADKSPTKSGDGSGSVDVDIAILDTGVQYDHPDLNVFKCVSFFGSPQDVPLPLCTDTNGHGTHVAGIAAAKRQQYRSSWYSTGSTNLGHKNFGWCLHNGQFSHCRTQLCS